MAPKYNVGQKIIITPVSNQHSSSRDSGLEPYAGQIGKITDYYWINRTSKEKGVEIFYIYTVVTEANNKQIVVHEDELRPFTA